MTDAARNFDHHSAEFARDPYAFYSSQRGRPVARSDEWGGFWVVTGYAEVHRAAQDDATFLSACPDIKIPSNTAHGRSIPIETDAPDTQRYRRILQTEMAPAAVAKLEPAILARTTELIDAVIEDGHCDLVGALAVPLPARTMLSWIGLDEREWRTCVGWVHALLHGGLGHQQERLDEVYAGIMGMLGAAVAERRDGGLRDDLLSKLVAAGLDDDQLLNYGWTLVVAGLDTTSAGLANALALLDRRPDLRRRLLDNPSLLPSAVEEFLRYESPVTAMARTAAHDVELGGRHIAQGDRLLLMWPAANRDSREFPAPDDVVLDRQPNRHLAFGVGIHRCMGSNIARSIMRIALGEVLARMPDYRVVGGSNVQRFPDASFVYAPTTLPVEFMLGVRIAGRTSAGAST
jgi:cytochrome P450